MMCGCMHFLLDQSEYSTCWDGNPGRFLTIKLDYSALSLSMASFVYYLLPISLGRVVARKSEPLTLALKNYMHLDSFALCLVVVHGTIISNSVCMENFALWLS